MFYKIPSIWLGQGLITFRGVAAPVPFYTRWTVNDTIKQEVEIKGHAEKQVNIYTISDELIITLENADLGVWQGSGQIEGHHLSWKIISDDQSLKGEEHFFYLDNGRIKTRAYFMDDEGVYTLVEGEIWKAI